MTPFEQIQQTTGGMMDTLPGTIFAWAVAIVVTVNLICLFAMPILVWRIAAHSRKQTGLLKKILHKTGTG